MITVSTAGAAAALCNVFPLVGLQTHNMAGFIPTETKEEYAVPPVGQVVALR